MSGEASSQKSGGKQTTQGTDVAVAARCDTSGWRATSVTVHLCRHLRPTWSSPTTHERTREQLDAEGRASAVDLDAQDDVSFNHQAARSGLSSACLSDRIELQPESRAAEAAISPVDDTHPVSTPHRHCRGPCAAPAPPKSLTLLSKRMRRSRPAARNSPVLHAPSPSARRLSSGCN